ncbi:hypothetical protein CDEST_13205 [Colletotrichum destructivum]|uniref:Uncharacterized protein n=1 Tax=Colletotrichum destructivum TaxID=34406 RepID=A0AAX4IYN3_9PEZI|nr:hypothetical protein CDEST_13205 [Colletotrichum destructivum]
MELTRAIACPPGWKLPKVLAFFRRAAAVNREGGTPMQVVHCALCMDVGKAGKPRVWCWGSWGYSRPSRFRRNVMAWRIGLLGMNYSDGRGVDGAWESAYQPCLVEEDARRSARPINFNDS